MKFSRHFKIVSAALLVAAAAMFCGYLLMQGREIIAPSLFRPASGARLIMSMDGFWFTRSDKGTVAWSLTAKNADLYESKEAQLQDLKIVVTQPGNKETTMFGDAGAMDTSSGNASLRRLSRDVRIITNDGYLLTTNSLFWKSGERTVWTADPFKLLGSELYLEGVGISANVDLHTIMVRSKVKAVLQE